MGAWTGTTMRFLNRDRMTGTFANVNFSAATQFLVYKQVSRATFGDIIGYRIWDGSSNIFSQWLSRISTPIGAAFFYPFSGYTMTGNTLVGSPTLISVKTSGVTQGSAFIDIEINDTTQVTNTSGSTAYLSGNTFIVGGAPVFGGTNDVEFAELIVYNKVLTPSEFLEVENYLKIKYQYNTWTIPTPTPTQTPTVTPTISLTPTITPTKTITPSVTKTPTPTPVYYYYLTRRYTCACAVAGNRLLRSNESLTVGRFYAWNSIPNYKFEILNVEPIDVFDDSNVGWTIKTDGSSCANISCQ
jgi:hypothetical protein